MPEILPKEIADLIRPRLANSAMLHPGLILDRLPEDRHLNDQSAQKEHLQRVVKARPWTDEQYTRIRTHLEGQSAVFINTARSRIALHLSRAGGLENANCCLHPVYGFAYLPGSGLKGLAHAYAAHLWGNGLVPEAQRDQFAEEVEDIFGWAPNRERTESATEFQPRSGRAKARRTEAQRGEIVFHDAFADKPPHLEIDVCTPHYGAYYRGEKPPGDWLDPVPVTFLTIAAGTKFRFRVTNSHAGVSIDRVEEAKRLLLGGLFWLGAGAKTAAGYGAFDDTFSEPEEQRQARKQAEAATLIAKAHQRLQSIWDELNQKTHVLWVPKQIGSGKGYRLLQASDGTWTFEDGWDFNKNPDPPAADCVYVATLHPTVSKRLLKPELKSDVKAPVGRPR